MDKHGAFEDLDAQQVLAWLAVGQQEHLYLDFKATASPDLSSRNDRKNFAIAISGFANADGGVIGWAIRTDRRDGVDRACALEPIANPAAFLGQLNELTASACSPPVPGVRHKIVETAKGIVALSWVPRSDLAPHMARAGEDRFYRRAGSSFRVMEAYEVRDLLLRESAPVLSVSLRLNALGTTSGGDVTRHQVAGVVSVANIGRASARAPFIEIEPNAPHLVHRGGVDGNGHFGLPQQVHAGDRKVWRFAGDGGTYLHPGVSIDVASLSLQVIESRSGAVTHPVPLSAICRLAADRYPLTEFLLEASAHEIMVVAGKAGRAPG